MKECPVRATVTDQEPDGEIVRAREGTRRRFGRSECNQEGENIERGKKKMAGAGRGRKGVSWQYMRREQMRP
jgi:hypothetical protein